MKKLLSFLVAFLFVVTSAYGALTGRLIDLVVNDSSVVALLSRAGVEGAAAQQAKQYVRNALMALGTGQGKISKGELESLVTRLAASGDAVDQTSARKLQAFFAKNVDDVQQEDVVEMINELIFIANRHGLRDSAMLSCAECISETLAGYGFRFTFKRVNDLELGGLIDRYIAGKSPDQITDLIDDLMRQTGFIDDLSTVSSKLLSAEEERTLALYLVALKHGEGEVKELAETIKQISKTSDGFLLLNENAPHTFWKIYAESMSPETRAGWVRVLKETAEEQKNHSKLEDAFYAVLGKRVKDDPDLEDKLEMLRAKNCFFRKS